MTDKRRSIFSRLVWLAIGLSLALVFGLWLLTDQTVRSTLEASARDEVDVDLAGLVDIYASSGQEELERRIADRLALVPADGNHPHYLLSDRTGRRLAGDIAQWPRLDAAISEAGEFPLGESTHAYGRATWLAPDLRLLVARETGDHGPLLRRIALVFLAGGAFFVLLVGPFGRLAAGRLQQRIERINAAFRDPALDRLAAIERPGGKDEIDELAAHSAAALSRMGRLMEAYRDTSDQLAHEIRTPLMHLDRRLVRALDAHPGEEVAQRLIESRDEIRRLVGTLESLLDIAASRARRGDRLGLKDVDLTAMVTRICELYAGSAEESGHEFAWRVEPGVEIAGEEAQLTRLVTNLLDNAFKYVPAGGNVHLTLDPGPVLTVADDGPGIPPAERERVFERFYRGATNGSHCAGSGLGLALARAIAERHGLGIRVLDAGTGAAFRIDRDQS